MVTTLDTREISTEIDKAFDGLRGINDSLKNLTGRTPNLFDQPGRGFGRGRGGAARGGPARMFNMARQDLGGTQGSFRGAGPLRGGFAGRKRQSQPEMGGGGGGFRDYEIESFPPRRVRRMGGSDFNFENPFDPKPSLASSVVMPAIESKSREVAITELKGHEKREDGARNRRMFANLMGTLSRFKKDEQKVATFREQERKQRAVEHKLESEKQAEKEKIQKEKEDLLEKRRQKQFEIKRLQRKRALVQFAERDETHLKRLQNFIQTQAKPPIFYIPGKHTLRTLELQKNTAKRIEEQIVRRQELLQRDLSTVNSAQNLRSAAPTRDREAESGGRRRGKESDEESEDDLESDVESVAGGSESEKEEEEEKEGKEEKQEDTGDKEEGNVVKEDKKDESMEKENDESFEKEDEKDISMEKEESTEKEVEKDDTEKEGKELEEKEQSTTDTNETTGDSSSQ